MLEIKIFVQVLIGKVCLILNIHALNEFQIAFCDEKISLFRRFERTTIGWKIGIDAYGINNMDLPCTGEKLLEARNQLILGASERWSRAPWTNSAFIGHLFGLAMLMSQVRRGVARESQCILPASRNVINVSFK